MPPGTVLSFARRRDRIRPTTEEEEIEVRMAGRISEGVSFCEPIHTRALANHAYVAPPAEAMWTDEDVARNDERERPSLVDNKIIPSINAVSGQEILGRYVATIGSRSRDRRASGIAEVLDGTIRWMHEEAYTEHEVSLMFRNALITGYGVLHKYHDSRAGDDGDGQVLDEEVSITRMIWDSTARGQNLYDRRWHMEAVWIPEDEIPVEWMRAMESPQVGRRGGKRAYHDGLDDWFDAGAAKSPLTGAWGWGQIASGKHWNKADKEVCVVRYEWKEVEEVYRAAVPVGLEAWEQAAQTGVATLEDQEVDLTQFGPDEVGQVRDMLLAQTELRTLGRRELLELKRRVQAATGEAFEDYHSFERWKFRYAWMANGKVVEVGDIPTNAFTYMFLTCFPWVGEDFVIYYGMVDIARGGQDFRNRFLSLALSILAVSTKEGLVVEESALGAHKDSFANDLARPGGLAVVPDGFFGAKRYDKLGSPQPPSFLPDFIGLADSAVQSPFGLSAASLGNVPDPRRVSSAALGQIREAASTVMSLPFDSLKRHRQEEGNLSVAFALEYVPEKTMVDVVGAEKARWILDEQTGAPLPKDAWASGVRLKVRVGEAPVSQDDRKEIFDFLTRTGIFAQWLDQDRIPLEVAVQMIPTLQESDREKIIEHNAQKSTVAQMMQLLQQSPEVMQFMQQSPEGQQLLQQFAQPGAPAAA